MARSSNIPFPSLAEEIEALDVKIATLTLKLDWTHKTKYERTPRLANLLNDARKIRIQALLMKAKL